MKKIFFTLVLVISFLLTSTPIYAATKTTAKTKSVVVPPWKAAAPDGYSPITWVGNKGVTSFMRMPESGNGYLDYLTFIYLPYNQIKFIASSSPREDWGVGQNPLDGEETHNWAFARAAAEVMKQNNPDAKFVWNAPYFNETIAVTDLSMALKATDASSTYVTSGSRPELDMQQDRRMLIIDNKIGEGKILPFDAETFIKNGDQAVEGFSPTTTYKGSSGATARLFIGIKPNNKELVVYCSKGAMPAEANNALTAAGVPTENQMQVDGGTSATCAYNLPGQYFVEPGRTLPHLMGAYQILYRATVTTDGLNVRSGPSTKKASIAKLPKGSAVIVYEEKTGFARIDSEQKWVSTQYLKKIQ